MVFWKILLRYTINVELLEQSLMKCNHDEEVISMNLAICPKTFRIFKHIHIFINQYALPGPSVSYCYDCSNPLIDLQKGT